jgi:hypothetical protein
MEPGEIATDMFHATAKDYLPHSENLSEEQITHVSLEQDHKGGLPY